MFGTLVYVNSISEVSSLKISKSTISLKHHQELLFKLVACYLQIIQAKTLFGSYLVSHWVFVNYLK